MASLAAVAGMSGVPAVVRATDAMGLPRLGSSALARDGGVASDDTGGQDPGGWRVEWDGEAREVGCDPNELISALVEANARDGAKLKLSKGCTYSLTAYQGQDGLPVITQPIAIKGEGATIERAASAAPFRVFNVGPGGELTLHGVTVRGGDDRSDLGGGGLLVQSGGKATVEDSRIVENRSATTGGGITNHGITWIVSSKDGKGGRGGMGGGDPEASVEPKDPDPSPESSGAASESGAANGAEDGAANGAADEAGARLDGWTDDAWSKDGWDHDTHEYVTKVNNNSAQDDGGGVYSTGFLGVDGAEVGGNNTVRDGGGLVNGGGSAVLRSAEILHNVATGLGGGVYATDGSVTKIEYSAVTDNESTADTAAGGGIFNISAALHVRHTEVVRNGAGGFGGGIYNANGQAVIEESRISENTTRSSGGGVYNVLGNVILRKSLVDSNRANGAQSQGAGIYTITGSLTLTEARVSRNDSALPRGGVFASASQVTVDDRAVIVDNRPTNCVGSPVTVPNCFG
ncbi:hypothetical protein OG792_12390 [Micromonospora sp. NBC_01699]|uniref:hypothetical protein n=1 Tax=Micromonospora sp. NBC_01699 TaxID=2975984 RepID=UPI002E359741|nr:hypothetical protein [Micromonospora sp. NBC_01699]